MNQMKIDEKDIQLYTYKIEFTKNYLKYIEKQINKFKNDLRDDFERKLNILKKEQNIF